MNPSQQSIQGSSHQQHLQNIHHTPQGTSQPAPGDDMVTKLIKLLRGFITFSQKSNPAVVPKLLEITEQFIFASITPKEYGSSVIQLLGRDTQSNLFQFLERSIPLLRAEIDAGRIHLDQIFCRQKVNATDSPSPQSGHCTTVSPQSFSGPSPVQKPMASPMQPPNSDPVNRTKFTESPLNHPPSSAPMFDGTFTQEQQIPLTKIDASPFSQPSTSQPMEVDNRLSIPGAQTQEIPQDQNIGDKSIFDRQAFAARLHQKMPECTSFEENALIMLADFLEAKIRDMLNGTLFAAEHRLEQLQHNPAFVPINDPKKQLMMIEKHERAERLRRENLEKEAILKMSKGKSKDSDVMEKAKQIRRADEEAMSNRQTNEAAKAALSGMKRQWPSKNTSNLPSGLNRPRKRHVTMRDLIAKSDKSLKALWNLEEMTHCRLGYSALNYNDYGCWCGAGGSGKPVDGIDECCMIHDHCYDSAVDSKMCFDVPVEYIDDYTWQCNTTAEPNEPICPDSEAIRCYTCDNESCAHRYGYVPEDCAPGIDQCYNLRNFNNKDFRAGCLTYTCDELRTKSGLVCSSCDSDMCNGPPGLAPEGPGIGDGTTFNSAPGISFFGLQCWTCDTKYGCRTPVAEECPPRTRCYTLKSLSTGDIVRKGCATDCLQINQNGRICETCDNDVCNSEQSLAPMNRVDEFRNSGESRLGIRSYQPEIGGGSAFNPSQNFGSIGSGTGYNPNGIGSGTGYNPNGIGSGTGYNPNGIGSGTGRHPGGIGSGTGYNPNQPSQIGSGAGFGGSPNGNYYPSANVGGNQYPEGQYGNGPYGRNVQGPHIGHGANPYNSAESVFNYKKFFSILISICVAFAL